MKSRTLLPLLTLSALALTTLSACTWVQLTSAGETVQILTANQVSNRNCERIGRASSRTLDRFVIVDRNDAKQIEELETLARNEAADMGGNAVVADAEVQNGRQSYTVYTCPS